MAEREPYLLLQSILIEVTTCIRCGVRFGIDADYYAALRNHQGGCKNKNDSTDNGDDYDQGDDYDHDGHFTCPNGHVQQFNTSDKQDFGEELAKLKHTIEQHEATIVTLRCKLKRAVTARDRYKKLAARKQPVKRDAPTPVVSTRAIGESPKQEKKR